MTEIPEEQQARALRAVTDAARERDRVIEEAQKPVIEAAVAAVRAGASRTRVREEAGVSPRTLYAWLAEAGIPVRAKRPKGIGT
ncbi:hypothetical protein ACFY0R_39705 [Streptomyces sp. NPDC001633]|uniref:hypothetical protein n=1 Tax=Streptomyces sp. NPDC001633 TaxID=3364595 RepID=UPI00369B08E5